MRRVFLLCLLAFSSPLFAQKAAKAKKAKAVMKAQRLANGGEKLAHRIKATHSC